MRVLARARAWIVYPGVVQPGEPKAHAAAREYLRPDAERGRYQDRRNQQPR